MEEQKIENVEIKEVETPKIERNEEGNAFKELKLSLDKLMEENKFMKDEIVKLKTNQVSIPVVEEKPYEVNKELWKELF